VLPEERRFLALLPLSPLTTCKGALVMFVVADSVVVLGTSVQALDVLGTSVVHTKSGVDI